MATQARFRRLNLRGHLAPPSLGEIVCVSPEPASLSGEVAISWDLPSHGTSKAVVPDGLGVSSKNEPGAKWPVSCPNRPSPAPGSPSRGRGAN